MAELRELAQIWEARGIEPELAMEVARQLTEKDALAAHARDELGLTEDTAARPVQASLASLVAFTLGALVPLVGFLVAPDDGRSALVFAAAVGPARPRVRGCRPGLGQARPAMARVGLGGAAAMGITLLIGELTGAALGLTSARLAATRRRGSDTQGVHDDHR